MLFKAMQQVDKKMYLLPFCDVDRSLNRECKILMKPEDMPVEYDDMLKFDPKLYART
jgi:hypothetical protein